MKICFKPIGVIHTSYKTRSDPPNQAINSSRARGIVDVYPQYAEGLLGIERYSHIILVFHLSQVTDYHLVLTPRRSNAYRGLFATRTPNRVNPIGLSLVKLISVNESRLEIENVDMIDGTPLLDIKPFIPEIDAYPLLESLP